MCANVRQILVRARGHFISSFATRHPSLCLWRRLGGILPNRSASQMFRDVARCLVMSGDVAEKNNM